MNIFALFPDESAKEVGYIKVATPDDIGVSLISVEQLQKYFYLIVQLRTSLELEVYLDLSFPILAPLLMPILQFILIQSNSD